MISHISNNPSDVRYSFYCRKSRGKRRGACVEKKRRQLWTQPCFFKATSVTTHSRGREEGNFHLGKNQVCPLPSQWEGRHKDPFLFPPPSRAGQKKRGDPQKLRGGGVPATSCLTNTSIKSVAPSHLGNLFEVLLSILLFLCVRGLSCTSAPFGQADKNHFPFLLNLPQLPRQKDRNRF